MTTADIHDLLAGTEPVPLHRDAMRWRPPEQPHPATGRPAGRAIQPLPAVPPATVAQMTNALQELFEAAAADARRALDEMRAQIATTPDGCQHCGTGQRHHARRWTAGVGWHTWVAPTDAQRKARMQTRKDRR